MKQVFKYTSIGITGLIITISLHNPAKSYPSQEKQTLKLSDGRQISYIQRGDPNGKYTIFGIHGAGGSRFEGDGYKITNNNYLKSKSINYIAFDRPGYGESTYIRNRNYKTFSNDLIEISNILNIDRFALFGVSSGGTYSLNCGFYIPEDKLRYICAVSSDGPNMIDDIPDDCKNKVNQTSKYILKYGTLLMKFGIQLLRIAVYYRTESFMNEITKSFKKCENDYNIISNDKKVDKNKLKMNTKEGVRQGVNGLLTDLQLQGIIPWEYNINELNNKNIGISIWHGTNDIIVPVGWAKYYGDNINHAKLHILENEGHVSTVYNHYNQMFDEIIQYMDHDQQ